MILILFGGLRRQTLRGFFDKLRGEGEILLLFFVQSWKFWWKIIFSVRSKMFSRSNSASAPNTVSMKRPCGVVVSMFSFRLTNSTPFLPVLKGIRLSQGYTLMKWIGKGAGHAPRSHNYHSRSLYGVFSTPSPFSRSTIRSRVGFHIFLNHAVLPNHFTSVGLIA